MPRVGIIALVIVLCPLWICPALGADGKRPFTELELNKFLADLPGFIRWCRKNGIDYSGSNDYVGNPAAWANLGLNELHAYLSRLGWHPPDRFFYILLHTAGGLQGWTEIPVGSPNLAKKLEGQLAEIKKDKKLSANEKQRALAKLEMLITQAKKSAHAPPEKIHPEEIKLIKNNRKRIMSVFMSVQKP
jgi:hypothetical protein